MIFFTMNYARSINIKLKYHRFAPSASGWKEVGIVSAWVCFYSLFVLVYCWSCHIFVPSYVCPVLRLSMFYVCLSHARPFLRLSCPIFFVCPTMSYPKFVLSYFCLVLCLSYPTFFPFYVCHVLRLPCSTFVMFYVCHVLRLPCPTSVLSVH